MSENEKPDYKLIITGWLLEEGTEAQYHDGHSYQKAPRGKGLAESLKVLIEAFKEAGYTPQEICGNQIQNKLVEECIPPEWRTQGYGKEIKRWRKCIEGEWIHQLNILFGDDLRWLAQKARKRVPIKKEEPKEKLPPLEKRPVLDDSVQGDDTPVSTVMEVDQDFLAAITVKKNE